MQKKNQPLSGDEIFSYVALAFMLTLMVVGIGYAAWINRPTPTIDTNHNFQVTRIETRNFKEGEKPGTSKKVNGIATVTSEIAEISTEAPTPASWMTTTG